MDIKKQMRPRATILLFVLSLVLGAGCETKLERTNYAGDVKSAEEFITEFYTHILEEKPEEAAKMCSLNLTSEAALELMEKIRAANGRMVSVEDMEVYTNVKVIGESRKGEYVITSKVQYEKEVCKEIVTITLVNSNPYVTGYKCTVKID